MYHKIKKENLLIVLFTNLPLKWEEKNKIGDYSINCTFYLIQSCFNIFGSLIWFSRYMHMCTYIGTCKFQGMSTGNFNKI